ncbi:MAG: pentapeptide repeat-containing protein [bacterium]
MPFTEDTYFKKSFSRLSQATILDKEFEDCTFDGCSFMGCRFEKCRFINCTFKGCMLSAIIPMHSSFVDVQFKDSKVIGFDWTRARNVDAIAFEECQVNYSSFRALRLAKLRMVKCEAREVDFVETDLEGGNFTGTDFAGSVFHKTNLTKADFSGAKNYQIDLRENRAKKAKFSLPEALSLLESFGVEVKG